jgi:predicted nucleic acid binding AN1-type Zn finger protein
MMAGCKCKLSQVALITNTCNGCNNKFCDAHKAIEVHLCSARHEIVSKQLSTLKTQLVSVGEKLSDRV